VSWAAHEFENYFLQRKTGVKVSFFGLALGALAPDLFTKYFVYHVKPEDAAHFHRGWPGVGFSHSLIFGVVFALVVLKLTGSRSWALGILIGQWAHVLTDFCDTAGDMPFFPFSIEPVSINMWKHAAAEGRYGDAAAYYSGLGGVWDFFWLAVTLVFARVTLTAEYFRRVVIPADPKVWGWLHRKLRLPERALRLVYLGLLFYGAGRMTAWFLLARFRERVPFQPHWGGPDYVGRANDRSQASFVEVCIRTGIGGVCFAAFLYLCWRWFIKRWWEAGGDPPIVGERGTGLSVAFGDK
jgi:membrane-bound metal-dependent hydrolase YbcI (DUF457 family)